MLQFLFELIVFIVNFELAMHHVNPSQIQIVDVVHGSVLFVAEQGSDFRSLTQEETEEVIASFVFADRRMNI